LLDDGQLANEREVIRRQARERRVEGNRANEFAQFFSTLEGPEKIYWRRKSANEKRKETREAGCAITCKMLPSLRAVSLNLWSCQAQLRQ
jgi:hypothetical protein